MAVRTVILILMAVFLCPVNPFTRISYAQEKDTILSDSGIVYPGGYDLNTVGNVQGRIKGVVIPDSGPVRMTLVADKETYTVLASPGWFWKEMDVSIPEGTEAIVRGSKSVGIDERLYIIAEKIRIISTNKTLSFRSESGKALWSGSSQTGQSGTQKGKSNSSGGYGSSSGSNGSSSGNRSGQGSSGKGRGGR